MKLLRVTPVLTGIFHLALALTVLTTFARAATTTTTPHKSKKKTAHTKTVAKSRTAGQKTRSSHRVAATTSASASRKHHVTRTLARGRRHSGWVQTWDEPTYANSTNGDNLDGEDLVVRRAAVEALGPYNGAIVVVDPNNGRILTMVNQKLALGAGFQPCSTIKLSVALAGLHENVIKPSSSFLRVARRSQMDLTQALARSNNYYFATLGEKLGYEKVAQYAHEFGYGEKAGLNIAGEQPGYFPPAPPKNGGTGMLTSFGEEIQQTPLQLAGLVSAIANGGKLYYLQYPKTQEQIDGFVPQVKRELDIANLIPEIRPGMQGAVEFGTARRAKQEMSILGKTGTCSQGRTRLGWFGSFNNDGQRKLVVVVLLTGGRPSIGPMAAGVAGDVYRRLVDDRALTLNKPIDPSSLIAAQICCGGR